MKNGTFTVKNKKIRKQLSLTSFKSGAVFLGNVRGVFVSRRPGRKHGELWPYHMQLWNALVFARKQRILNATLDRKNQRMNLSRKLNVVEFLSSISSSKCALFGIGFKAPSCKTFRNSIKTLAIVNEAVLKRVEEEWKVKLSNARDRGNAIFVLGPMGAGKSTTIENCFKTHPEYKSYAYVDTDEIMGAIDAFTADRVHVYYLLARKIAISLTDWILTQNISFVAEGTCVKYRELIEYMERLKETGYKIHVNRLAPVPLDEILRRSKHRKNRIIPDDVVKSIYNNASIGLNKLYEHNKKVDYKLFRDLDISTAIQNDKHDKPFCIRR